MPYARKKVFKRKRRTYRKRKTVVGLAKSAYRMAKSIKRSQEKKYANLTYTSPLSTTFNYWGLHEIAQGDTASTRDGDMITIKSIRMRLCFDISGNNPSGCEVRAVLVQDTQQIADTAPSATDIFLTNDWNSTYNYPTAQKRFKVLWDRTINCDPKAIAYSSVSGNYNLDTQVFIDKWIFPRTKNIYFNGVNTTDVQRNGLFLFMAKSNGSTTITPDHRGQVCFLDS